MSQYISKLTKRASLSLIFITAILVHSSVFAIPFTGSWTDNFDSDPTGSNVGPVNWSVNGTVDVLGGSYYQYLCNSAQMTGNCIDMDGSTGQAGQIISLTTFDLLASASYELLVDVAGSQRYGTDGIIIGIMDSSFSVLTSLNLMNIASSTTSYEANLSFSGQSGAVHLFIQDSNYGNGGDNVGALIDNVRFNCTAGCQSNSIPEPAPLALLALGLTMLGFYRRT